MRWFLPAFILASLFFFIPLKPLHAYLDPGTSSLLIQMIVAAAVGSLLYIKFYWKKLVSLFKRTKVEDEHSALSGEKTSAVQKNK